MDDVEIGGMGVPASFSWRIMNALRKSWRISVHRWRGKGWIS